MLGNHFPPNLDGGGEFRVANLAFQGLGEEGEVDSVGITCRFWGCGVGVVDTSSRHWDAESLWFVFLVQG